jgi:hypothetical protein
MARAPNYKFERLERQRQKAAKRAARVEAKRQKSEERKQATADAVTAVDSTSPQATD